MELYQAGIIFAVAFAVTYLMVPVSKKIAQTIGAIDYPGNRRINDKPIPRCGGIALYVGFLAALFTMYLGTTFFGWRATDLYVVRGINYSVLFVGITIMFTVGLVDDITQLSAPVKLVGQIVSVIVVVAGGVSIGTVRSLFDGLYVDLGWIDWPLTVIYLVAFVNIINLIDGLDGLAAGIVAIVAGSMLYLVLARGSFTLAVTCIALIGICLAFLRFNFHPASIFMGDSGALFLGLIIGIVSISGIVRTQSLVAMLIPLVLAGVPVLDTLSAIVRRRRQHSSVGQADMGHIHHRLVRLGLGQRTAVLILYAASAVLAVGGCLIGSFSGIVRWAVFGVLFVVMLLLVWRLGLFSPVLRHYYENRGAVGPREPRGKK